MTVVVNVYLLDREDGLFDLYRPHKGSWRVCLKGLRPLCRPKGDRGDLR